ncbi:MAG: M28 family peptidase, partial [Chthonomonadales bacterium]
MFSRSNAPAAPKTKIGAYRRNLLHHPQPWLAVAGVVFTLAGCTCCSARSMPPSAPASPTHPKVDGDRAYQLLVKQCDFGPRPVGSAAHQKTRDFLLAEMKKYADRTDVQDFTYRGMPLTNIIGVFNPDAPRSILFCTHWDTRPTADEEVDPLKQRQPIPGADDGASGTAVLLELARIFHEQKPRVGVILVLLDGEDYGNFETNEGVFLGSTYFARHHDAYKPSFGILIDMIGDKNLDIYREANSQRFAPGTNDKVFRIARELGYGSYFIDEMKLNISDDHVPLSTIGHIPTIDLIDFNYAPWHTLDDTPDKCSPQSLAIVG